MKKIKDETGNRGSGERAEAETRLRSDELRRAGNGEAEKVVETVRSGKTVFIDPEKRGQGESEKKKKEEKE